MTPANPDPSLEAGHETSDASARGVWYAGAGLVVCSVLIMLAMAWLFHAWQAGHDAAEQADAEHFVAPSAVEPGEQYPGPRLQVVPGMELAAFRAMEDQELQNYGWIDRKTGVVRLPIKRAMDLIAQRGLPWRGEPNAPKATRTVLDMQEVRPMEWGTPPPRPPPPPPPK